MHCFAPLVRPDSRILILGSYPSPLSFESGFYYGHPRNRFWPMIAALTGRPVPQTVDEKKQLLIDSHIALWDVLDSCEIKGAADASIRNPVVNPISSILADSRIQAVFFNGAKAAQLFARHCAPLPVPSFRMPSTSPANAAWNIERLKSEWSAILPYLKNEEE